MNTFASRSLLGLCLVLAVGCGDSDSSTGGLDKLGSDMKDAGKKMGSDLADAGSKLGEQLAASGKALDAFSKEAAAGLSMKGDQLATMLKGKLPELEKILDQVKTQLNAKGGALKDMVPGLTSKFDSAKSSLDALAKGGAEAGADLKKAALDAFTSLSADLKSALAKLQG